MVTGYNRYRENFDEKNVKFDVINDQDDFIRLGLIAHYAWKWDVEKVGKVFLKTIEMK